MRPPFPKAVVFDWDNTLVDSWDTIAEAMNHTRHAMGLGPWTLQEVRQKCTRAARETFPEWFGEDWKKAYDIYYAGFDEARRKRNINIRRGSHELLLWLKENNIPRFVVSNKRGDYLRQEADLLQWTSLFDAIVGAQDAPRDKPAREHVDHALRVSAMMADISVWFVGDSEADMLCAQNAGCTPVFIGEPDEAKRLGVELVFDDCTGLQTLFQTYL